jgi:hypothetical protein
VTRTLNRRPSAAPLGGLVLSVVAAVADRAGQVDQEREPGHVDPCGYLGPGVVGGLPV